MMFFTSGISLTPRWTLCETILLVTLTVTLPTPEMAPSLLLHHLADQLELGLGRITQLHVERNVAAAHLDVARQIWWR